MTILEQIDNILIEDLGEGYRKVKTISFDSKIVTIVYESMSGIKSSHVIDYWRLNNEHCRAV